MKFKEGDVVVCVKKYHDYNLQVGNIGIIRVVDESTLPYGVEWRNNFSDSGILMGRVSNGLWVCENNIELVVEKKYLSKATLEELKEIQREITPLITKLSKPKEKYVDVTMECSFTPEIDAYDRYYLRIRHNNVEIGAVSHDGNRIGIPMYVHQSLGYIIEHNYKKKWDTINFKILMKK